MHKSQTVSASSTTIDSFLQQIRRSTSSVEGFEELTEIVSFGAVVSEKARSSTNTLTKKSSHQPVQQLPPRDVAFEAGLRVSDQPYQNLLIVEKELELKMLEEEARSRHCQSIIRKKESPNDELRKQLQSSQQIFNQKRQFAVSYYNSIVAALTAAAEKRLGESALLQQRLERQYQQLGVRLNEEKHSLDQIRKEKGQLLEDIRTEIVDVKAEVAKIKEERSVRLKANSFIKRENTQKRKELETTMVEFRLCERELQALQLEEKELEQVNRSLRDLLGVQEQHTKTCMVLERAIILREQQKVQQEAYNRETAREYESNMIPQLKTLLREKLKENDMFSRRLDERIKMEAQLAEKIERLNDKLRSLSPMRTTYIPDSAN